MMKTIALLAGLTATLAAQTVVGPRVYPFGTSDPATCSVGQQFIRTDIPAIKACTATNTWSSGGGSSTPGGSSGQMQTNSSGSFGGQSSVFGTGVTVTNTQRGVECTSGVVSLSGSTFTYPGGTVAAAAAAYQEFAITGTMNGTFRYDHVLVSETTQFASGSVTATTASIGRTGSTASDEALPQMPLMVSSGDAWFSQDKPGPPILGVSNTYTLYLALRTTGGNVSALTAGAVAFEVCGYAKP